MQSDDDDTSSENALEKQRLLGSKSVDFNVVLDEMGKLGIYQGFLIFVMYLNPISGGLNMVAPVFTEATPDNWCALPPLDNHTLYPNMTIEELKNLTLPYDHSKNEFERCRRYNYSLESCTLGKLDCIKPYPPQAPYVVPVECDKGYTYDTSVFNKTVVTEWNLVCGRGILKSAVDSIFFLGVLVGAVVGGSIGDRLGRVPTIFFSQIFSVAVGVGCAFSPNLASYTILRFILATFVQTGYLVSIVYVMEITGARWRTCVGINVQTMFTLGEVILSLFAMQWRDWRSVQLYISFIPLAFCFLAFFVPESPMWLFSRGKSMKAEQITEMMFKRNRKTLSPSVWIKAEEAGRKLDASLQLDHYYTVMDLFKRKLTGILTLKLLFLWFVCSLVYYGLAFNVGTLSGNLFVNNILNAAVEPVGYVIIALTMDRVGRKPLLTTTLLVGGIGCLVSTFTKSFAPHSKGVNDLTTAMSLLGKMCIAGSFAVLTNYTTELYPTVIRTTAVGVTIMGARIGAATTPFALLLQDTIPWMSGALFGILSFMAALISFFLPETLNKPMMTSLDEAEIFYKSAKTQKSLEDS